MPPLLEVATVLSGGWFSLLFALLGLPQAVMVCWYSIPVGGSIPCGASVGLKGVFLTGVDIVLGFFRCGDSCKCVGGRPAIMDACCLHVSRAHKEGYLTFHFLDGSGMYLSGMCVVPILDAFLLVILFDFE